MPNDIDWTEYLTKDVEFTKSADEVFNKKYIPEDLIHLNTKQLINSLEGKNKTFVEQIEKQQEQNYGNYDVFRVTIQDFAIEVQFGEMWITFYFKEDGTIRDTSGTGQGHRYENWLRQIAEELFNSKQDV